jgi:hypothetical protein
VDKEQLFRRGWDLLADGNYALGLPLMEANRYGRGRSPITKPTLSFPEWDGSRVGSLLVVPDQGLGDQIQYARFIPELLKRADAVTLLAAPAVAPLFAHLGCTVMLADGTVPLPRYDAWIMAGSLSLRLGVRLETLSGAPYLRAPENGLAKWPPNLRYGVVWRGSPVHSNDHNRSMSAADAAPLLALPGAFCLHPEDTKARSMADTAAIIDRLEAVITVDTSVAHLAGAMGKRALVMLPATHTDWRWLKDRSDSPWYDSVRLYRQQTPGDWTSVVRRVLADLS